MTDRDRLHDVEPDVDDESGRIEFAAPIAQHAPKRSREASETKKPTKTRSTASQSLIRAAKCLDTDVCGHECVRSRGHEHRSGGEHACSSCIGRSGGRPAIEGEARTKRFVIKITPTLAEKLSGKDCSTAVRAVLEEIASGVGAAFTLDITESDSV